MSVDPNTLREVVFPGGERRPALGLGTWKLGESRSRRSAEVGALRLALDIGYRVIDTAEMYGEGGAEEAVGEAVAGAMRDGLARGDLFIVSKVYPHNASRAGVLAACERSLRRLKLDSIDLYLLHWRGREPLAETVAGFLELQRRGWIRRWGVSNFDISDLQELFGLEGGSGCSANQVYYSLGARGVEFDVLPWQRERDVPLMAYCPIDQGALARRQAGSALREVAERHGATPVQVALAALLAQRGVMAIPKAVREAHLRENWGAAALSLDAQDLAALDRDFPPPRRKVPLAMT
jgi:diketogulonate reductase-like aldo/keto reductase